MTGLATVGAVFFAYRQFTLGRQSSADQEYSSAVDMLSDGSALARSAGVQLLVTTVDRPGNQELRSNGYKILAALIETEVPADDSPDVASEDDRMFGIGSLVRRHVDVQFALDGLLDRRPLPDGKEYRVNLVDTDLRGAMLIGGNLSNVDLRGARLEDVEDRGELKINLDLRCSDLRGANVTRAHLDYSDLRGANLSQLSGIPQAHFNEATIDDSTELDPELDALIRRGQLKVQKRPGHLNCKAIESALKGPRAESAD